MKFKHFIWCRWVMPFGLMYVLVSKWLIIKHFIWCRWVTTWQCSCIYICMCLLVKWLLIFWCRWVTPFGWQHSCTCTMYVYYMTKGCHSHASNKVFDNHFTDKHIHECCQSKKGVTHLHQIKCLIINHLLTSTYMSVVNQRAAPTCIK